MGKVLSHLGEVGRNRGNSQRVAFGREEVEEEVRGSRWAVGANLSAALGVPMEGLLSSASLAWEVLKKVQRNLLEKSRSSMRSWRTCQFEMLDRTC